MKKNKDVRNDYALDKKLGESIFGVVYSAENKNSKEKRAIKIIDKNIIRNSYRNTRFIEPDDEEMKNYINSFFKEIRNMENSEGKNKENENTVKFYECFENENELAIVMELCDDNMLNYLSKNKNKLSLEEIYEIINQLNKTFKIMADNKIIYGDLKLENILLKYINDEKTKYIVKLKVTYYSELLTKLRDTVSSMSKSYSNFCIYAPEVLRGESGFTEKTDLWSLGIIIYVLIFKKYPYKGTTKDVLLNDIKRNNIEKIDDSNLNDLIKHLLVEDPNIRYGWSQYFSHPFFNTNNKQNLNFRDYYEIINRIGKAKHADIFKVKEKKTNEYRAIKAFDKKGVKRKLKESLNEYNKEEEKKYIDRFHNEIENMKMICKNENKNIVKFYESYDNEKELASVMELCDKNLLDFFVEQKRPLNYDEIYEILTQLNNCFRIMTQLKIVHRALNLENILIKYENEEKTKKRFKLKFTDDSILISKLSNNYEAKGNMNFIAPEILKKEKYNENSDLWSLGIIIYVLSFKEYPYKGSDKAKLLKNIKENKLNNIKNDELGDLIKKLLIEDPKKRLNWNQYFNHPFFRHKDYKEFRNYYEIEKIIGNIEYADVYKARDKKSNELRAIKVFNINKIKNKIRKIKLQEPSEKDLEPYIKGFFNEINHMKMISEEGNQNTVKFYEYFQTEKEFAIVMELCDDNLLTFFTNKEKFFDYKRIYNILSQLNNSFRIMSKKKLVHRDLNLENILIKYENDESREYIIKLKLTDDSGLLDDLIQHQTFKIKGNTLYIAPEILKKEKYDEKCDLWSLGVIIYALAFKNYPYQGNVNQILKQIKETTLKKIDNENLNDLMKKLLVEDPKKRLNWEQYFNHPFFTGRENENYKKYYIIEDRIGSAKNAVVYKVKERISKISRAIKVFDKNKAISEFKKNYLRDPDEEEMKYIVDTFSNEFKYMKKISEENNENIVKFYEIFESKDELAIVMELCDDNLLNLFIKRKAEKKVFTNNEIHNILIQLNNSFKIMNKYRLIHRALNLENILIKYKNEQKTDYIVKLKLTDDSGSLDDLSNLHKLKVSENTNYIAPEILRGQKYNEECDLWSLGVIIYILTFGNYPYKGDYESEILIEISKNNLKKAENPNLDNLIKKLLIENPQQRMNWKQYFSHSFFK